MMAEIVKDRLIEDDHLMEDSSTTSTVCFADDSTVLLATPDDVTMKQAMNLTSVSFGEYFLCQGMKVNPAN